MKGWKGVEGIKLAQDWVQWLTFVNTVMELKFR